MIKNIPVFVHGNQDQMYDLGQSLGFTDDKLGLFSHSLDEFQLTLMVDTTTGLTRVTHLDDQPILLRGKPRIKLKVDSPV